MGNLNMILLRSLSAYDNCYVQCARPKPHKLHNGGRNVNGYNAYGSNGDMIDSDDVSVKRSGVYTTKANQVVQYMTFEVIGEGSFGIVYGATNQNNEYIAIKRKKCLKDFELMQKSTLLFRSELEALFNLDHQNIVKLLGVEFLNDEVISLVMEYIKGISLEKYITDHRYVNERTIKLFTTQLVDTVAYMHSRLLIHRDIKSSNIMIIKKRMIKLIDFGMARLLHVNSNQVFPVATCVGTAPYMAPEVQNFQGYDSKADIWSIGALVYEMATGDVYVHHLDETRTQTMMLADFHGPVYSRHLSNEGNDFMQQCLIKNPLQRPTARALLQHPFIQDN